VVPDIGDKKELNHKFLEWVINNIDSTVPYHLLPFIPSNKMQDVPMTELDTLKDFAADAKRIGFRYIYIGDVWGGNEFEDTNCYNCGAAIISRSSYKVNDINLVGDRCPNCGFKIDVVIE
jgi:pyruvate formate lyase activating enzyme